ncbi:MAG: hypothetical protein ACRCXZ_05275 [Patescibacteria group bacterium]
MRSALKFVSMFSLATVLGVGINACGSVQQIQDERTYELDHKTSLPFFNNTPKRGEKIELSAKKGAKATLELEAKLIDTKGNESEKALGAISFSSQGGEVDQKIPLTGPLDFFRNKNLKVDHIEADLGIETNVAKLESATRLKYEVSPDGKSVRVYGTIPPSSTIQLLEQGKKVELKVKSQQDDKDVEVLPSGMK